MQYLELELGSGNQANNVSGEIKGSNLASLSTHPSITIRSRGAFLKDLGTIQSVVQSTPILLPRDQNLVLEVRGPREFAIFNDAEAVTGYELGDLSGIKIKSTSKSTILKFDLEGEEILVEIFDKPQKPQPVVLDRGPRVVEVVHRIEGFRDRDGEYFEVRRKTSPWRSCSCDHSSESGSGVQSGGER